MGSSRAAASVTAVIAAAGSGERLGAGGPKAFVQLCGRPMVEWSLEAFLACEAVGGIVVACPPGQSNSLDAPAAGLGGQGAGLGGPSVGQAGRKAVQVVDGGATRAESVSNALALAGTELVAIHDAARPLVTTELVEGVLGALLADRGAAGAIAATPVTDTIKRTTDRRLVDSPHRGGAKTPTSVEETVERDRLWAAQTPQVFRTEALRQALDADQEAIGAATDEAMLVEAAGGKVLIHPSTPKNLKVTTPLDLKLAELLLGERAG